MDTKLDNLSEMSQFLSVKTRMSDDLFHLFGKFGIGHLLSRLSLEKQDGVSASELILSLCWKRVLTCIERILRILEEVLGMTPQHLMATISGNDKEMSKILVMAEALEKWNEVRGKTLGSSEIWSDRLKLLYNRHTESLRERR